MPEYYDALKTSINELEKNGREQRLTIYLNARNALIRELRLISPPLSPADIARRRLELEQAIRKIELESAGDGVPPLAAAGSEELSVTTKTKTASVLEVASAPAEIEPAPEDVFRRAIEAAKNSGIVSTSGAATPPKHQGVRVQPDEDSTVAAEPERLSADDEDPVGRQPPLVPLAADRMAKTARDDSDARVLPAWNKREYADVVDLGPVERKARRQTLLLGVLIIALALGAVALAWSQRGTIGQIITTVHGQKAGGT
jgi:hypothetical protein